MFVVDIPFGVQESHDDPARENGLILITGIEGNNQGMWIYGCFKKNYIFVHIVTILYHLGSMICCKSDSGNGWVFSRRR